MNMRQIRARAKAVIADALLDSFESYESEGSEDGDRFESTYLGTVFCLMPSGKYYTPFANSNVDSCPRCKGSGEVSGKGSCKFCGGLGSREAYEDEVFQEALEDHATKAHGWIENGEGDPCDVYFVRNITQDKPV